jgi:hypothetical protein
MDFYDPHTATVATEFGRSRMRKKQFHRLRWGSIPM